MRKKELYEQNTVLYNRLQTVCAELERYKKLYDENIKEINALRRTLADIEIKAAKEEVKPIEEEFVPAFEVIAVPEEEKEQPVISSAPIADVSLGDLFDYASEVIGMIVVEGTKANNEFVSNPNEYSKDLVNLVLGKTEVCKSSIYEICNSDADESVKRAQMDVIYKEAVEYFNGLYKQI